MNSRYFFRMYLFDFRYVFILIFAKKKFKWDSIHLYNSEFRKMCVAQFLMILEKIILNHALITNQIVETKQLILTYLPKYLHTMS